MLIPNLKKNKQSVEIVTRWGGREGRGVLIVMAIQTIYLG